MFQAIPDESSIVAGLRTGQVTLAEFSSALSFQVAKARADARGDPGAVHPLGGARSGAATRSRRSKLEVRQAIALALDRPAILQIAGSGLGQRLGVLPPGLKGWALPWQELPNQQRDVREGQGAPAEGRVLRPRAMKIRNIVGFPALARGPARSSWTT